MVGYKELLASGGGSDERSDNTEITLPSMRSELLIRYEQSRDPDHNTSAGVKTAVGGSD